MSPQDIWATRAGFFTEQSMNKQTVLNRVNAILGNVQRACAISNTPDNTKGAEVLRELIAQLSSVALHANQSNKNDNTDPQNVSIEESPRSFSNK